MGFYLYTGNKLEKLAELFREQVYARQADETAWLTPETVVIQTQGMGAWLKLELAKSAPLAANLNFPFLNKFIESVLEKAFPDFHESLRYLSKEVMAWRIFHIFSDHPETFPELNGYFSRDTGEQDLKKYQLAVKVAGLFDQYQIYHGDMLGNWRRNGGNGWQERLYLELAESRKSIDRYFNDFLSLTSIPEDAAPKRISVFGISTMAPVFLQFFVKLAEFRDVHFFYLNPCSGYWSEILSSRQAGSLSRKTGVERESLMDGNPLLASMGTQGRDFFRLMMELPELNVTQETACFEPFREDSYTMLTALQQDILDNTVRGRGIKNDFAEPPLPVTPDDRSVTVHNCHSPLREVEVLHDRLMALLQDRSIQPHDIIVMAPDISVYEPYVNAVFGTGALRNCYAFSDRSIRNSNRTAAVFLSLLKLWKSKYEVSAVFDLLEHPAIRRKWNLETADLSRLRQWTAQAGIRWGINAENREELCSVGFEEYSWEQGLDRLLLGYAVLREETEQGHEEIISLDAAEGGDAEILGAFIQFAQALFSLRERFGGKRTLAGWCELLNGILDEFFLNDNDFYLELAAIRSTLDRFANYANQLDLPETLSPELILHLLENGFGELNASEPFLRGKITFCSLVPMRSIPMKIVAILGLNDGAFPRRDVTLGFNLITREMRRLDRSPNQEDRYLFLESILAARERLLFFYQGRNSRGDDEFPPAVPLGELIDCLLSAFEIDRKFIETDHKLQAFDFDYFNGKDPEKYSFSESGFKAAKALAEAIRGIEEPPRLLDRLKPCEAPPLPESLPLRELEDFFCAPQAYYLKNMAGLYLREELSAVPGEQEDDEPLALEGLDAYKLGQDVGRWTQAGIPPEEQYHILSRTNRLPVSSLGRKTFRAALEKIRLLPETWQKYLQSAEPVPLKIRLCQTEITGEIPLAPDGLTHSYCRYANFNGGDAVRWYLRHLLLAACRGVNARSFAWDQKDRRTLLLSGMEEAEASKRLMELLELYREGQSRILPFFKEAAFAYASHDGNPDLARKAFYTVVPQQGISIGDCANDKAVALLFTPSDFDSPEFTAEFAALARTVFRPFLLREVKYES